MAITRFTASTLITLSLRPSNLPRKNSYATLKVYTGEIADDENREISIYKKFAQLDSSHPGRKYVRTMLDSFGVQGPQGYHQCLVHRPLWQSMFDLQHRNPRHRFTEPLLRAMLLHLFVALDYVHISCHLIHTGGSLSCLVTMDV